MSKPCKMCRAVKPLEDFPKESRNSDGRAGRCKACVPKPNPEKRRTYLAKYRAENSEALKQKSRAYYRENREKMLEQAASLAKIRKPERRARMAKYRENNREVMRAYFREYVARRVTEDEDFRETKAVRMHMSNALLAIKAGRQGSGTLQTLGYPLEKLKAVVEARFQPGMSWDNHGKWHVDHKIPVLYFVLKGEVRPSVIHALCNLQPLWAAENIAKGNKHPLHQEKNNALQPLH